MFQAVAIAQKHLGMKAGYVQRTLGTTEIAAHHTHHHPLDMTIRHHLDSKIQPHQVKGLFLYKYHNVLVIFFPAPISEQLIAEDLKYDRIYTQTINIKTPTLCRAFNIIYYCTTSHFFLI